MEEIRKSGLTFQEAKNLVDVSIRDVKDGFVATGYYLWIIREERLWKDDGYNSFQEFLHCQYQKDKSWASRCIGLYEKFGKQIPFGELPVLAAPYRDYSLSQLIEMVPMTEEQREQVTPDMKVREIRELKPKREKKTEGQKETPSDDEDSIPGQRSLEDYLASVATVATGEGQEEAQEAQEPPEGEKTMEITPGPEKGQETALEGLQGAGELDGNEAVGKRILDAEGGTNGPKSETDPAQDGSGGLNETSKPETFKTYDRDILLQMISNAEYEMKIMGAYWLESGPKYYTQKAMEIQAYKNLLAEHDAEEAAAAGLSENPAPKQPVLPVLKNDGQRKEWLKNYKLWGLWYRDEHIDVNYYKFDFDNGSRLVAAEFPDREWNWGSNRSDDVYYHLIEKGKRKRDSILTYDDKYQYHGTCETEIVEYLKKIQQKKKGAKDDPIDSKR